MKAKVKLETAVLRRLAVEASCDPSTIQNWFLKLQVGELPRGMPGHRAHRALIEAGLVPAPVVECAK